MLKRFGIENKFSLPSSSQSSPGEIEIGKDIHQWDEDDESNDGDNLAESSQRTTYNIDVEFPGEDNPGEFPSGDVEVCNFSR